jgi:hypothetical protein
MPCKVPWIVDITNPRERSPTNQELTCVHHMDPMAHKCAQTASKQHRHLELTWEPTWQPPRESTRGVGPTGSRSTPQVGRTDLVAANALLPHGDPSRMWSPFRGCSGVLTKLPSPYKYKWGRIRIGRTLLLLILPLGSYLSRRGVPLHRISVGLLVLRD